MRRGRLQTWLLAALAALVLPGAGLSGRVVPALAALPFPTVKAVPAITWGPPLVLDGTNHRVLLLTAKTVTGPYSLLSLDSDSGSTLATRTVTLAAQPMSFAL